MDSNLKHGDSNMEERNTNNNMRVLRRLRMGPRTRLLNSTPYVNPNKSNTRTNRSSCLCKLNPDCHARFVDAISQLGGINRATPEAVLALMNKEDQECLNLDKIANQIFSHRFKRLRDIVFLLEKVRWVWTRDQTRLFNDTVMSLGGVNRATPLAIMESMIRNNDYKDYVNILRPDEIAAALHVSRISKLHEEKGYKAVHPRERDCSVQPGQYKAMPAAGDSVKAVSDWSDSGSFKDILDNFRELSLKPMGSS